jgi:ribosomal protein S20
MSKIQERAMIVGFHQGKWGAKVKDKEAEAYIKNMYESKGDVGTFSKKLMPDYVKDINKIYNEAYKFHTESTVPYNDNGERFILNQNYFHYVGRMKEFQSKANMKLQEMVGKYTEALEEDKLRMNKGFKPTDYPTVDELQNKYKFFLDVKRIPENDKLFSDLEADTEEKKKLLEEISAEKEKEFNGKLETAMKTAWKRVYDVVKHMEKTLSNPDARLHSSVVDNIIELCDILPQLNITNDPKLEEFRQEVLQMATAYRVEVLRDSPHYRQETAKSADDILKKMEGYL